MNALAAVLAVVVLRPMRLALLAQPAPVAAGWRRGDAVGWELQSDCGKKGARNGGRMNSLG
jgi:hypothetical protein